MKPNLRNDIAALVHRPVEIARAWARSIGRIVNDITYPHQIFRSRCAITRRFTDDQLMRAAQRFYSAQAAKQRHCSDGIRGTISRLSSPIQGR